MRPLPSRVFSEGLKKVLGPAGITEWGGWRRVIVSLCQSARHDSSVDPAFGKSQDVSRGSAKSEGLRAVTPFSFVGSFVLRLSREESPE